MDSFEISTTLAQGEFGDYWSIEILVNGRSFLEQVRAFEQPFADAEGHPDIAGDYAPVPALSPVLYDLADELVGKGPAAAGGGAWATLFECGTCFTPGCWPLAVTILAEPERIVWQQFLQVHRRGRYGQAPWDYTGFGPFNFDRRAYETEVQKLRDLAGQIPDREEMPDGLGE